MDEDAARRRKREDLLAGLRLETRLRKANPPTAARAEEERRSRYDRIVEILRKVDDGSPDASYVDTETAELLRRELVSLERADPSAASAPGDGPHTPLVAVERFNTILYCRHWLPTVRFYRDDLDLPVVAANDWYVEFRVTSGSSLSIADSTRATTDHVGGQGITLSLRVTDLAAARMQLADKAVRTSEIRTVGNAIAFYVADPEGHRIELWSDDQPEVAASWAPRRDQR